MHGAASRLASKGKTQETRSPYLLRALCFLVSPLKVFAYLNLRELLAAGLVSRDWNALSRENFLWRELAKARWESVPAVMGEPRE